jgi:hypothetical protein
MSYNRRTVVLVIVAEARHPHDSESNADTHLFVSTEPIETVCR